MCGPDLPTELIREIITLAAQTPHLDFLRSDWAQGVDLATLHALCLTSRGFNEMATRYLYAHPVLADGEAGRALVRTLRSDRWREGMMAGKADEWIRKITLGWVGREGEVGNGSYVREVMGEVNVAKVEDVAVVGLKLGGGAVEALTGKSNPSRDQLQSQRLN